MDHVDHVDHQPTVAWLAWPRGLCGPCGPWVCSRAACVTVWRAPGWRGPAGRSVDNVDQWTIEFKSVDPMLARAAVDVGAVKTVRIYSIYFLFIQTLIYIVHMVHKARFPLCTRVDHLPISRLSNAIHTRPTPRVCPGLDSVKKSLTLATRASAATNLE